jgi:hypothetical protein
VEFVRIVIGVEAIVLAWWVLALPRVAADEELLGLIAGNREHLRSGR